MRSVVRRQTAGLIRGVVNARRSQVAVDPALALSDRAPDPERQAIEDQHTEVCMRILQSLPQRDRDVLGASISWGRLRSGSEATSTSPKPNSG